MSGRGTLPEVNRQGARCPVRSMLRSVWSDHFDVATQTTLPTSPNPVRAECFSVERHQQTFHPDGEMKKSSRKRLARSRTRIQPNMAEVVATSGKHLSSRSSKRFVDCRGFALIYSELILEPVIKWRRRSRREAFRDALLESLWLSPGRTFLSFLPLPLLVVRRPCPPRCNALVPSTVVVRSPSLLLPVRFPFSFLCLAEAPILTATSPTPTDFDPDRPLPPLPELPSQYSSRGKQRAVDEVDNLAQLPTFPRRLSRTSSAESTSSPSRPGYLSLPPLSTFSVPSSPKSVNSSSSSTTSSSSSSSSSSSVSPKRKRFSFPSRAPSPPRPSIRHSISSPIAAIGLADDIEQRYGRLQYAGLAAVRLRSPTERSSLAVRESWGIGPRQH